MRPPVIANPSQLTKETWYTYNVLDLLTLVSYPSPDNLQSRTFVYDDLGQLTQQTTPEAGTWSYTYNNFGQVLTRTDARGVVTTYAYDTLNRPQTITYDVSCCSSTVPATNQVTYTYASVPPPSNNNGRLINVTNTTVSQSFTYDALGRVTQNSKVINGTTYNTNYAYGNLSDALTQVTYPSGRVVKQDFDVVGRLAKLYKDGTTKYADTFGYNAAGQSTGFTYGNGVVATYGYSADRLQMTSLSYVKTGSTLFAANYYYKLDASNCPTGSATGNNGQIQCIKDTVDNGRSVAYTYDALYRLSNAVTTGSVGYPAWGLSWTYDRYGNRTAQSTSSGCSGVTCPTNSVTINPATNRLTDPGYTYDANGNMTNDGANALGYDAENHMVTTAGWAYVADGAGLRVRRCTPNCTSPTSNTVYIFNGSQVIAEYDNGAAVTAPTREYIYLGERKLAVYFGSTITYYHADHLSNRRMSNSSGSGTTQLGNFPFGEAWYGTGAKWRFTSYERDTETGNDYAVMRSSVNRLGRFSSPDVLADSLGNPQAFNRYSYVLNDPCSLTDPLGLKPNKKCPLIVTGISTNPWNKKDKGAEYGLALARTSGFNIAFPFAGEGKIMGMLRVLGLSFGFRGSAASTTSRAISYSSVGDEGTFILAAISGGAQTSLSTMDRKNPPSKSYFLMPAAGYLDNLPKGSIVIRGRGIAEGLLSNDTNAKVLRVDSGHGLENALGALIASVDISSWEGCSQPRAFSPQGDFDLNDPSSPFWNSGTLYPGDGAWMYVGVVGPSFYLQPIETPFVRRRAKKF